MGAGHRHATGKELDEVHVGARARIALMTFLALVGVAVVLGLAAFWPDGQRVARLSGQSDFAAPGVTFPRATITALGDCAPQGAPLQFGCVQVTATLTDGDHEGQVVSVPIQGPSASAGLVAGDTIQLMRVPAASGLPEAYSFFGIDRTMPLGLLLAIFVVVVLAVARLRGLLALIGLVVSGAIVLKFMLPAILTGEPGVPVTIVAALAIIFVVLYLAHGPSIRTSTALAGTIVGVAITGILGYAAVGASRLTGVSDETSVVLGTMSTELDFRVLLTSAIIIAGLGVLNDVTITQSSAVWELRAAAPELGRRALFRSGMRIGRDHIASTIYTIVFAYAGASLSVLLLLYLHDRPVLDVLGSEDIATEVARTLCSAIGLVLAVPVTTAIAALTVSGPIAATGHRVGQSRHAHDGRTGTTHDGEPAAYRRTDGR